MSVTHEWPREQLDGNAHAATPISFSPIIFLEHCLPEGIRLIDISIVVSRLYGCSDVYSVGKALQENYYNEHCIQTTIKVPRQNIVNVNII